MVMKIVQPQALGLALDVSVPLVDLIDTVALLRKCFTLRKES